MNIVTKVALAMSTGIIFVLFSFPLAFSEDAEIKEFQNNEGEYVWECMTNNKLIFRARDRDNDGLLDYIVFLASEPENKRLAVQFNKSGLALVEYFDKRGALTRTEKSLKLGPEREYGGEINVIKTFKDNELVREETDDDGDGIPNSLVYYGKGKKTVRSERLFPNGIIRERICFKDGVKVLEEHYRDTGMLEHRILYKDGVQRTREYDTNGDGVIDKFQTLDDKGKVLKEEKEGEAESTLEPIKT